MVFMVPRNAVIEGDYDKFVEALQQRLAGGKLVRH
jgi:hypothetical protein